MNDEVKSTNNYFVTYGESFVVPSKNNIEIIEVTVNDFVVDFDESITIDNVTENTIVNIYYEETEQTQENNMLLIIVVAVTGGAILIGIVISTIITKKNKGKKVDNALKNIQSLKQQEPSVEKKETVTPKTKTQGTGTAVPKASEPTKKPPVKRPPAKKPPKLPNDN